MMIIRGCARCGGSQYADWDELTQTWELVCFNCSSRVAMKPTAVLASLPPAVPYVLAAPRRGLRA